MTYRSAGLEVFKPNPHASLRLFCFPYAGGSAGIFRDWQFALPAFVELVAIQLPGHAQRMKEPAFTRMAALVESLITDVRRAAGRVPFDFFGHSMGAIVAFEVARKLRDRFSLSPMTLFVSGRQAPHLAEKNAPTYKLPDHEFVAELRRLNGTPREVFDNPELIDLLLAPIRADFEAIHTYRYSGPAKLACPIYAFGGLEDSEVSEQELDAWRIHTSARFRKVLLPGQHFFLNSQRDLLLKHISQDQIGRIATSSFSSAV